MISAIIVGGSVAGLSSAHALLQAGCEVCVVERAGFLTAAGAGLGLDAEACAALQRWGLAHELMRYSLPLSCEEDRAFHSAKNVERVLAVDEDLNHRALHWSDLHRILYQSLPPGTVLWGHQLLSFTQHDSLNKVKVKARLAHTSQIIHLEADLLVAADGSMSQTRQHFLPHEKRRYCGYCAWRGVLDTSSLEGSNIRAMLNTRFPKLGHCLYFIIGPNTHACMYELQCGRLNWLWYVNRPEPQLKNTSVTAKAEDVEIEQMHSEASLIWPSELAALMQATPTPFVNAIFDKEPLQQLFWNRVVLVGEAAHPTSPHGLRSTNMSIIDADVLGQSIIKWGSKVDEALQEYQSLRLAVTSKEVRFSRHLGQVKQGLLEIFPGPSCSWLEAQEEHCQKLLQRNLHSF